MSGLHRHEVTPLIRGLSRRLFSNSASDVFSDASAAELLISAASPTSIPRLQGLPEVIVTGRANVGKSTLLNALLGRRNLAHTSQKPGRTRTLNFYRVGREPGKLILVDAPGYGARGRPQWGEVFNHYVKTREELRRVYVLVNATHGLNDPDRAMLQSLDAQCQATSGAKFTLQAVITKADGLLRSSDGRGAIKDIQRDIFETAPTCLPAIVTAALEESRLGIDDLRKSIEEACGLM
ncbi:P-loop containing nucleoside triphosphate hydrolase protein [Fomitopsis serialis]|uniref:P-loop containing nucleoside triphosphate hydrolase protein n=1 Tax=Fomitopsis serialis TaxID=139415 RepID=UPI0020078FC4|nr:P-loop containing nucleoside triphosphate hydrolase protein [Neoantrodia serialis]KAH9933456.1 P-loop containing nucleoside triphosphate hydrolase protein [Neoantrodia serialis]